MPLTIPQLMLGTSPFIGAGQFGLKAYEYRARFYDNEANMTRLFVAAARREVKAVQLIVYEPLVNALRAAIAELDEELFVAATIPSGRRFESLLALIKPLKPAVIAIHALSADALDPRIPGWIKQIRAAGASPAAATHCPGETIPELDRAGLELEAYLAPLNTIGYAMVPDYESTLAALERTDKRVIAIKPLAAGRLTPTPALFKFIYAHADAACVGIASEVEMNETFAAARQALG